MSEPNLESFRKKLAALNLKSNKLEGQINEVREGLATAIAKTMGVSIGSVVYTEQKEGYGDKGKLLKRRYRVEKIIEGGWRNKGITLWGRTLRKDGAVGERKEVWREWKVEEPNERA